MAETPINPFVADPEQELSDHQLIAEVLTGDRSALEALCTRHQPWIYNIAFRMVLVHEDAEDVTQEILIKMITKLSTFDSSKAAFRTWLYRVVANHVINMKTSRSESSELTFDKYYNMIQSVPDENPENSPEIKMLISDLAIGCVEGVLLCLDRKQRLVFILAVILDVPGTQGSEILGLSPSNYRKILSRARSQLHQYMDGNCGIINEKSPCRCHKKVTGFMKTGGLSPDRITFAQVGSPRIRDVISQKAEQFEKSIYSRYTEVFRDHPFYTAPDLSEWLCGLLDKPEFKEIFQLD